MPKILAISDIAPNVSAQSSIHFHSSTDALQDSCPYETSPGLKFLRRKSKNASWCFERELESSSPLARQRIRYTDFLPQFSTAIKADLAADLQVVATTSQSIDFAFSIVTNNKDIGVEGKDRTWIQKPNFMGYVVRGLGLLDRVLRL